MLLHEFTYLHVGLFKNSCLMSDLMGVIYECYIGQRFGYYKRFLLAMIILFNQCLMCDQWLLSKNVPEVKVLYITSAC